MCEICTHTTTKPTLGIYVRREKSDPTRTTTLRNLFVREMRKRFNKVSRLIRVQIIEKDVLGLQPLQTNQFAFSTSQAKVKSFMEWLDSQVEQEILQIRRMPQYGQAIESAWTDMYVEDSYKRGVQRARYEMRKAKMPIPGIEETGGISASMSTPFHMDRVGVLYTRVFEDLKGITSQMDTQISRVLSQGMIDGDGPALLARKINGTIQGGMPGLTDTLGRHIPGRRRAEILARTEVIRAHHQGMVQEYKNWGVEGVKVQAEWTTAGDDRVCEECSSMQGNIYTLDEISNMIPKHPQCRCIALPTMPEIEEAKEVVPEQESITEWDAAKWKDETNMSAVNTQLKKKYNISISDISPQMLDRANEFGSVIGDQIHAKLPLFRQTTSKSFSHKTGTNQLKKARNNITMFLDDTPNPVGNLQSGAVASYNDTTRHLRFGTRSTLNKTDELVLGRFNVGETFASTARHEYAHHLENHVFTSKFRALYKELGNDYIQKNISHYAAANYREFFAESFSAYTSPLYGKTHRLPLKVEKALETIFGKRIDL